MYLCDTLCILINKQRSTMGGSSGGGGGGKGAAQARFPWQHALAASDELYLRGWRRNNIAR